MKLLPITALRPGFLLTLLLLSPGVSAEHGGGPALVKPGIACPKETVLADAATLQTKDAPVFAGRGCRPYPFVTPVVAVEAGPFKDFDGDVFFVVQLDKEGQWFTIAWHGINTNLHLDARGQAI